jgi:hypothetical protein
MSMDRDTIKGPLMTTLSSATRMAATALVKK